jgi:hypothetical protein
MDGLPFDGAVRDQLAMAARRRQGVEHDLEVVAVYATCPACGSSSYIEERAR